MKRIKFNIQENYKRCIGLIAVLLLIGCASEIEEEGVRVEVPFVLRYEDEVQTKEYKIQYANNARIFSITNNTGTYELRYVDGRTSAITLEGMAPMELGYNADGIINQFNGVSVSFDSDLNQYGYEEGAANSIFALDEDQDFYGFSYLDETGNYVPYFIEKNRSEPGVFANATLDVGTRFLIGLVFKEDIEALCFLTKRRLDYETRVNEYFEFNYEYNSIGNIVQVKAVNELQPALSYTVKIEYVSVPVE